MNILFFLIPKSDVVYIYNDFSLEKVLNMMENHRYTAIPIIDRNGRYVGTITEGDMLWALKNELKDNSLALKQIPIMSIPRKKDNQPVNADAKMVDLISKAMSQNFVPVTDDDNIFIGIITRKDIIQYCYNQILR